MKSSPKRLVIFVADTMPSIVHQVRDWVTDHDLLHGEVHGFASGRELLRRLDYQMPDLLILDVGLSRFDALTALRTLGGSRLPVVLTAQNSRDDARLAVEGLLAGARDVWLKRKRHGVLRLAIGRRPFLRRTSSLLRPRSQRDTHGRAAPGAARVGDSIPPGVQSSCRWLRLLADEDRIHVGCAYTDLLPGPRRLTLAMGTTTTAARLFGSLLLPDQSASPLVVRLPHSAGFGPALQEALSRRWNRAVLELDKHERIRCGQWRFLPGRALLEVLPSGEPGKDTILAGWTPNRLVDEERSSCAQLELLAEAPRSSLAILLSELPGPALLTPLERLLAHDQLILLHVHAVRDAWHSLSDRLTWEYGSAQLPSPADGLVRRSS